MKIFQKTIKAFTLTEAVVAAAVLTIGILGIMQVFPRSVQGSNHSQKSSVAINLAQDLIEETAAKPYANIAPVAKVRVNADAASEFYNFYEQLDVVYVDANLAQSANDIGLKKITATISWQENGEEKTVVVPTLISQK